MRFSKQLLLFFMLISAVSIAASAEPIVTVEKLCDGRWYNDEFAFHFSADGTFKSYQTQNKTIGTILGTWKFGDNGIIKLEKQSQDGDYFPIVFKDNTLELKITNDPNNPKAGLFMTGLDGTLVVWHSKSFLAAGAAIQIGEQKTASVTTGYQLTATTDNLRLRNGPGTSYEYKIWTYMDDASKTIKTHTSVLAGSNLRILARTASKEKVNEWYNYWYYVEYKEPLENGMLVYKNAWMFGEFLNVAENKNRAVTIDFPENNGDYYGGASSVTVIGSVTGAPVTMKLQIKSANGTILSTKPMQYYLQTAGTFKHTLSGDNNELFIGSNTISVIAVYSDGKTTFKQITFYLHEYQGERAKPVIYLYPKTEVEVSVKVNPANGVSVSEPAYGDGWTVIAKPDGTITNKSDGSVWPYLFWESKDTVPPMPKTGFVVKKAELPAFFREKLAILGLNEKETADFIEYWIPLLKSGAYYLVSFFSQEEIDKAAPLSISPKPDCVIRIFFDARPLSAPMTITPQVLQQRTRFGFSVIEWGGMKYPNQ